MNFPVMAVSAAGEISSGFNFRWRKRAASLSKGSTASAKPATAFSKATMSNSVSWLKAGLAKNNRQASMAIGRITSVIMDRSEK